MIVYVTSYTAVMAFAFGAYCSAASNIVVIILRAAPNMVTVLFLFYSWLGRDSRPPVEDVRPRRSGI